MARRAGIPLLLAWSALPPGGSAAELLRGINYSGLEISPGRLPGRLSFDYVAPTEAEFAAAAAAGMTVVRLPVLWERLQPQLGAPLDGPMLAVVREQCGMARRHGLRLVLDLHNYGTYRGGMVGSPAVPTAAFAAFWGRLASAFSDDPDVIFGLMNEPHGIGAEAWAASEQAAVAAIRAAGAGNPVLASGTGWDGAHNFVSGAGYGVPNATALKALHDPAGNLAVEVHQYLDRDSSGTHGECVTPEAARQRLAPVTAWLRRAGRRGFLGEAAASATPECLESLAALLGEVEANQDAWLGWAYWAGGPWWGDYMFSIEPKAGEAKGARERPQMAVLRRLAEAGMAAARTAGPR